MSASTLPGVLLVRGDARAASAWVRRGVTPSYVVPLGEWTAAVPAGPAQARAPYDDPMTMMASRPAAWRLRPAIGVFVIDDHAAVVAHPRGLRALSRWLVWLPGRGPTPIPGMPEARAGDLTRIAGVSSEQQVRAALHERSGSARAFAATLLAALAVPGGELLEPGVAKRTPGAVLVEPDPRSVQRFEAITADDEAMRRELEEHS